MKFDEIISQIIKICKKNNVSELYLFGSYAKNLNRENSDIDIVIDGNYNYFDLEDEINNIMTLKKIDLFEKKNIINNKYLMGDFVKYAKRIY